MKHHPDRTELLQAVQSPSKELQEHLHTCQDCGDIYKLLVMFQVAGNTELIDAPEQLIVKAKSLIIQRDSILSILQHRAFEIVFDSWENLSPASVRNSAVLHERRLQYKADDLLFDLRAEKQKSEWKFTAQVNAGDYSEDIKVVIGKNIYTANEFGLIQWNSKKPPKSIRLVDKDTSIELPEIHWKI